MTFDMCTLKILISFESTTGRLIFAGGSISLNYLKITLCFEILNKR